MGIDVDKTQRSMCCLLFFLARFFIHHSGQHVLYSTSTGWLVRREGEGEFSIHALASFIECALEMAKNAKIAIMMYKIITQYSLIEYVQNCKLSSCLECKVCVSDA